MSPGDRPGDRSGGARLSRPLSPAQLAARIDATVIARWDAEPALSRLGRRLVDLGLTERAVQYCFGVRVSIHGPHAAERIRPAPGQAVAPAALMAHLWTGGGALPLAPVRARLGPDFDLLRRLGLLACTGDLVQATVTIVPVGSSLVVSDRADVQRGRHIAMVADDSALHTAGLVPASGAAAAGAARWLDVGTGSAFIPLSRPGAAQFVLATDINPRAVAMARLSAALSRVTHIDFAVADLLTGARAPWDLITFNAPIPAGVMALDPETTPTYRRGDSDILARFWQRAGDLISPGGEVIVHSWQPTDGSYPASLRLGGQVIALCYTPPRYNPAFGVTVWRKRGPDRCVRVDVPLSVARPYLVRSMLPSD